MNTTYRKNRRAIRATLLLPTLLSVTSAQKQSEPVLLDPFDVTVTPTKGYMATNTISGTAMNTPLREVPMAINVITSEFLADSLVGDLYRVFDYNSSITQTFRPQTGVTNSMFSIRGFANRNILVDGLMGGHIVPTYMIDRIEVVKGPNTLYGQSDPGGLINIVTKRPTGSGSTTIIQKIGEQSLYETQLDVDMAPVNDRLKLRLIGAYKTTDGWRPADGGKEAFIGLMGDFELTRRTQLFSRLSATRLEGIPTDRGTWSFERIPTDLDGDGQITNVIVNGIQESTARYNNTFIPRDFSTATLKNYFNEEAVYIQAGIRHRFNDQLVAQYQFNRTTLSLDMTFREFNTFNANGVAPGQFNAPQQAERVYGHTLNVIGDFTTGSAQHRLLLGARTTNNRPSLIQHVLNMGNVAQRAVLESMVADGRNIRLFLTKEDVLSGARIWEDEIPTVEEVRSLSARNSIAYSTEDVTTLYLTDSVALGGGRVRLLGGVRHIQIENAAFNLQGVRSPDAIDEQDTSIQFGAVYNLTPNLNAFANYATAFNPNRFNNLANEFFPPEESTAYEVGFKFENLWNGRMGGSLSYFNIEKVNVVRSDHNPVTLVPDQEMTDDEAKGIETELFLNLTPNWNTVVNYSYLDAKVVKSRTTARGMALEGAAPHRLTLWTSYNIDRGPLKGLRFGGGVVWADGPILQFGTSGNALVREDGYTEIDLFARYHTRIADHDVTLGVNVDNANDVFYVRARAMTNSPRQVVFSARIDL